MQACEGTERRVLMAMARFTSIPTIGETVRAPLSFTPTPHSDDRGASALTQLPPHRSHVVAQKLKFAEVAFEAGHGVSASLLYQDDRPTWNYGIFGAGTPYLRVLSDADARRELLKSDSKARPVAVRGSICLTQLGWIP